MKGIQDDQGVERRLGEKPRASHISPETLDVSDSDQSDLKLDSAAVTTKSTTCDPTRKLIPIYLQKYQPKFDAVSEYQKVNGDLCLTIWSQNPMFRSPLQSTILC